MIEQNYSVLMSVYRKEKAEYLQKSIDSMLSQTVPPQDFVIVCDGLLGDELNQVLQKKKQEYPECFQIVQLPENRGLGEALKEGLVYCKNELVARMDSDDISVPERCEWQLKAFAKIMYRLSVELCRNLWMIQHRQVLSDMFRNHQKR